MTVDRVDSRRSLYSGGWRIDLTVRAGVPRLLPYARLARAVAKALEAGGAPSAAAIGLTLSDDRELSALNGRHMGQPGPTDVLSFPAIPPTGFPGHAGRNGRVARESFAPRFVHPPGRRMELGDIIVSVERAIAQASAGHGGHTSDLRWNPRDELRLLVIHGALHVCGWDHVAPDEEAAMRALELRLLDASDDPP